MNRERRKEKQEQAIVRQAEYDALPLEQKKVRVAGRRGNSEKELQKLRDQHQGAIQSE